MTTILTLALDPEAAQRFEALRREHYPPALNRIPAHVSLFHQLPGEDSTRLQLRAAAASVEPFAVEVTGLRSLGRGVAFTLTSPALISLHRQLASAFEEHLIPQDRQRFQPHVVVQNKVDGALARTTLEQLRTSFVPWNATATGLLWWEYLGGPWKLLEYFDFRRGDAATS